MRERPVLLAPVFKSALADLLSGFLAEKRAAGYRYNAEARALSKIDTLLLCEKATHGEIPRHCLELWLDKCPGEHPVSHQKRVTIVREFARYLVRNDIPAYIPHGDCAPAGSGGFTPRVFTFAEIRSFLDEVDRLKPFRVSRYPLRHLVMPELFRVLYGCGLRLGEARKLRVGDVDLDEGILNIRDTKFGKHRLVPLAPGLTRRLRRYRQRVGVRQNDAYFFAAPDGGPYDPKNLYQFFRNTLSKIGMVHGGRGYGPRIHDLRHSFSVHRLIRWYREGADLTAKVAILATYLGHRNVASTQKYLHLVPELFPEVTKSLEESVGYVVPRRKPS